MGWFKRARAAKRAEGMEARGAYRQAAVELAVKGHYETCALEWRREECVEGHRAGAVRYQHEVELAA